MSPPYISGITLSISTGCSSCGVHQSCQWCCGTFCCNDNHFQTVYYKTRTWEVKWYKY